MGVIIKDQDRARPVIIAADNDGENAQTKKQLASAVSHLEAQGHKVFVVAPQVDQADYNDLLKQGGRLAVQDCFKETAHEIGFAFLPEVIRPVKEVESESLQAQAAKSVTTQANSSAVDTQGSHVSVAPEEIETKEASFLGKVQNPEAVPSSQVKGNERKTFYHKKDIDPYLSGPVVEALCYQLMGRPSKGGRSGKDIRYGKGSQLSISLENGTWRNFESNQSGNLYQLVMQEQKVEFKQAFNIVRDHVLAYRQDPTKIQNVLENAQVTQGQEAKGKTTSAATNHKSPPCVKTAQELEDEKPFVGTPKEERDFNNLRNIVKNNARLLDEDKIKLIRLAKGNIAQGLKTWEQQQNVWAKEDTMRQQSDLERRIEDNDNIPDSYKRVYLEDAKRDPIGTLAKIMKIDEEARDVRLKEAAMATANPISAPPINSNSEVSRDSENKADTVVSTSEGLCSGE